MSKMNEKAREHDYYISGYAMNSYQPPRNEIDLIDILKKVLAVVFTIASAALLLCSMFGIFWIKELGHNLFLGFSSRQLVMGCLIGLSVFGAIARS